MIVLDCDTKWWHTVLICSEHINTGVSKESSCNLQIPGSGGPIFVILPQPYIRDSPAKPP